MAGYNKPANAMEADTRREAALLELPPASARLTREQLLRAARLLAICRTNRDREIVALRALHKLSFDAVALRVEQPAGRVQELWRSVCARERAAAEIVRRALVLERLRPPK